MNLHSGCIFKVLDGLETEKSVSKPSVPMWCHPCVKLQKYMKSVMFYRIIFDNSNATSCCKVLLLYDMMNMRIYIVTNGEHNEEKRI